MTSSELSLTSGRREAREDFPLSEVPAAERKSALSLTWILFGFTFFTATMMAGASIGHAYGYGPRLWGVIALGNGLLALYASLLAVVAYRSGLSTVLMCAWVFGDRGSRLADLILGLTQVGWFAWGIDAAVRVLLEVTGWDSELRWLLMPLATVLFCSSAVLGYRGLQALSTVMVPMMAVLGLWSALLASQDWQNAGSPTGGTGALGLAEALTIIVGTFVSGATQSPNWSRYARSQAVAVGVTGAAFFLGNGFMVVFGALGAAVYDETDIAKVLLRQGFVWSALFMLLANIWSTQDNTIYNVSVAGCHLFRSEQRRRMTVLGSTLGLVLALLGFADHLVPFLLFLGTAIPPVGGVILADFFWVRRGTFPKIGELAPPDYQPSALIAWLAGAVLAGQLPGIPPVTGIVLAFLVHASLSGRRPKSPSEQPQT